MTSLNSLEYFNESKRKKEPTLMELIYYTFFKNGISKTEVDKQSIPYILSMMNTNLYFQELEKKAMEKKK